MPVYTASVWDCCGLLYLIERTEGFGRKHKSYRKGYRVETTQPSSPKSDLKKFAVTVALDPLVALIHVQDPFQYRFMYLTASSVEPICSGPKSTAWRDRAQQMTYFDYFSSDQRVNNLHRNHANTGLGIAMFIV